MTGIYSICTVKEEKYILVFPYPLVELWFRSISPYYTSSTFMVDKLLLASTRNVLKGDSFSATASMSKLGSLGSLVLMVSLKSSTLAIAVIAIALR